jgi:hypothetical protein
LKLEAGKIQPPASLKVQFPRSYSLSKMRLGVDIGGAFTDFAPVDLYT